ncbi:MAG: flagellar export chaperone FliS [Planctomycetota bacterium]
MPPAHPTQRYREVQVTTAAKDDLLMLLLDGGVRFIEGALIEMRKPQQDREKRNDHLLRAQKIVLELMTSLSPAIGLDLFSSLQGLYRFTFQRLLEGNLKSDIQLVEEGLTLMRKIHEIWRDAVVKARGERDRPLEKPHSGQSISVVG